MLHAVVMAGGAGTTFWPESRVSKPKQLLSLTGEKPMIAETLSRLRPLIPPERTWVVCAQAQAKGIQEACPELNSKNLIVEPCRRDTAACAGLAALIISSQDPEAVLAMLPADHEITPPQAFQDALETGASIARKSGALVTFGIKPTRPATGYGYIRRGEILEEAKSGRFWAVDRFTEKPNSNLAQEFLADSSYFWNSGIFAWEAKTLLAQIETHLPRLSAGLETLRSCLAEGNLSESLASLYPTLPSISLDYGILEKAENVIVMEASFDWSDLGSWDSLWEEAEKDEKGNAAVLPDGGALIAQNSSGVLAYSSDEQTIALLGVHDLVVVRTPDVVLVAQRDRVEEVKDLVEKMRSQGREDLLE
ncbi:MAG TPA: mannose-1-phosphate guanylyltransferase [Planctomycetes bacterium]|nr:mannose-1-phosphate guanylyltransferase [Planctomycetota bacterium]